MKTTARYRSIVVAICIAFLPASLVRTAYAQLSAQDIEALRQRGPQEGWTFTIGETSATRLPVSGLCGLVRPADWYKLAPSAPGAQQQSKSSLPGAWDWRQYNCLTPIRDQGRCGSCWAFAGMGAFESTILINDGVPVDLSEQWLVSCTQGDCSGGFQGTAFTFLSCGGRQDPCGGSGAVWESAFPYVARNDPCGCPYAHPYCLSSWSYVGTYPAPPSISAVKQAILDHGPVSASMWVNDPFVAYTGGVFNACGGTSLGNHAVVLVGWDDSQGTAGVWILRNSWGTDWGEAGYARIEYGCLNGVPWDVEYVVYADSNAGVWVDFAYAGTQMGSFWFPYNTLSGGMNAVAPGGVVTIKGGSAPGPWTLSKPMTLRAGGGAVTIGS